MRHVQVPVFDRPFRFGEEGEFAVVEQDSFEDVAHSVEVLLETQPGSRIDLPRYGYDGLLFSNKIDTNEVLSVIAEWEPRATAIVGAEYDGLDSLIQRLNIQLNGRGL